MGRTFIAALLDLTHRDVEAIGLSTCALFMPWRVDTFLITVDVSGLVSVGGARRRVVLGVMGSTYYIYHFLGLRHSHPFEGSLIRACFLLFSDLSLDGLEPRSHGIVLERAGVKLHRGMMTWMRRLILW